MGTDAELVNRCRAGSAEALAELVERFRPDVFAVCLKLLRHRHDAEDVAQESLVRVVRGLGAFDRERPLKPWVLRVTVNRCRTALAKRPRLPAPTENMAEVVARPASGVGRELADGLAEALKLLRDDYREAFVLFHEAGLGYDEIAAAIGRPVGTVKTWLHRARAQLFQELTRRGLVPAEPTERGTP